MSDVKVSGLPSDSSLDGNHYVPINDPTGPTTKRTLLSTLAAWFFDQLNIPSGTGSPVTRTDDITSDFILSGLVWSGDAYASTRNASMTSGVVYINGRKISIGSVTARTFTASKDTYIDVLDNADGTGTLVYTEVTNNAASPSLASNSIRIGIVVTGASNIAAATSISQGGFANTLPTISSQIFKGFDSLGNLIYPKGASNPRLTQNPYKFHMYRNAAFTSGNPAVIQCDTKLYDTGNNCDVVTNKGRFTAPVAGFYQINFGGAVSQTAGNPGFQTYLRINNTTTVGYGGSTLAVAGSWTYMMPGSQIVQLAAGDYLEVFMYGSSVAGAPGLALCYMSGFLVSTT